MRENTSGPEQCGIGATHQRALPIHPQNQRLYLSFLFANQSVVEHRSHSPSLSLFATNFDLAGCAIESRPTQGCLGVHRGQTQTSFPSFEAVYLERRKNVTVPPDSLSKDTHRRYPRSVGTLFTLFAKFLSPFDRSTCSLSVRCQNIWPCEKYSSPHCIQTALPNSYTLPKAIAGSEQEGVHIHAHGLALAAY